VAAVFIIQYVYTSYKPTHVLRRRKDVVNVPTTGLMCTRVKLECIIWQLL